MMSEEILVSQTTGKKYRIVDTIRVWDDEDDLDFTMSAQSVAEWCLETHLDTFADDLSTGNVLDCYDIPEGVDLDKWYKEQETYLCDLLDKKEYEKIIEITKCRYCEWEYSYQTIEEVNDE